MKYNIHAVFFSPTRTTSKIVLKIAESIKHFSKQNSFFTHDITLKSNRNKNLHFEKDDLVIIGLPVYAGRIPNILLTFLEKITSNSSKVILVNLFGNRNFDNALIELLNISKKQGFIPISAAAFIGEHSFSNTLAKNRPDENDLKKAYEFAKISYNKLESDQFEDFFVSGETPQNYYIPKDRTGNNIDMRKVKPKTNENCTNCFICANLCPMESIDFKNAALINGICIKCGACIKFCPNKAKYFDDVNYIFHKEDLENSLKDRKEPILFF